MANNVVPPMTDRNNVVDVIDTDFVDAVTVSEENPMNRGDLWSRQKTTKEKSDYTVKIINHIDFSWVSIWRFDKDLADRVLHTNE